MRLKQERADNSRWCYSATGNGTKKTIINQNACEQTDYGIQRVRPKHLSNLKKMAQGSHRQLTMAQRATCLEIWASATITQKNEKTTERVTWLYSSHGTVAVTDKMAHPPSAPTEN
jgi:hypothetical protein